MGQSFVVVRQGLQKSGARKKGKIRPRRAWAQR